MVDPIRLYEYSKAGAAQVSKLLCGFRECTVANNQEVVAATSGSIIRIHGWGAQSGSAVGTYFFKSNSGGTQLTPTTFAPLGNTTTVSTAGHLAFPVIDSGYFETTVSHGLFVDVGTAVLNLIVFYTLYQP